MSELQDDKLVLIDLTTSIVGAYVTNNSVPTAGLADLIANVYAALSQVQSGGTTVEAVVEPSRPAVPIKKSVAADYIICLEDGKKFKSLKRHLSSHYNMTPDQYREKWGLPADYPMVAPAYAEARSNLAKQMGLGQQRRKRS